MTSFTRKIDERPLQLVGDDFKERALKFAELECKLVTHEQTITGILEVIHELMNPAIPKRRNIGFKADFDEEWRWKLALRGFERSRGWDVLGSGIDGGGDPPKCANRA